MFDFSCTQCGETTEELIEDDKKKIDCPVCGGVAKRQLAAPRIDWWKMGLDPAFASASDKWAKAKRHNNEKGKKDLYEGGNNLRMY